MNLKNHDCTKLRNIEDTEKAKRQFFEDKTVEANKQEEDEFAVDRFYKARRIPDSDSDALAKARKEAMGMQEEKKQPLISAGRRELATDDQVCNVICSQLQCELTEMLKVMSRFKNRQQNKK